MAGQQGSKGNPAGKRMMNPKHAERRARSWARGEKRKQARVAAQEERRKANIAALGDVYNPRATQTRISWKRVVGHDGKVEWREVTRYVSLPPSKQIDRMKHAA